MDLDHDGCKIIINCGGKQDDHRCCPEPEYAEVYSQLDQQLSPSLGLNQAGQVVLLENTFYASANIDVSQAAINGKIIVNKAGWYEVLYGVSAYLNPLQSPLKVWSQSIFRNGVIVPGSTFANMTLSPEQQANGISSHALVHFDMGDFIELANTSDQALFLSATSPGSMAQQVSAFLKLQLMKAD